VNKYLLAFTALAAVIVLSCGCAVPQHKYNELKEQHDQLLKANELLTKDNKDLKTSNEVLANKLKGEQSRLAAAQALLKDMNEEKPPEAPKEGWKTNPKTGGIVLEGDIMFAAGSSKLSTKGKATLKRLAGLLNSQKYMDYFVRIDGHTDDVPVKLTIKENKDNWFLSAKRGHAVLEELKKLGVADQRLFVVGYGEHHPIVPNKPGRKGTPANRRVEIVLVKEVKLEK
jgi:flagellar motor protein MotB